MYKRLAALLLAGTATFVLQAPACAAASDTGLDTRVHVLSEQLRRLACQDQTLADSNADLAVDLRRQIRRQLHADATKIGVRSYLVQHYGDFVLYWPPVRRLTYLLWFGPVLLLTATVLDIVSSRKQQKPTPPGLDADAQTRLTALLIASPPENSRQ